MSSGTGAGSAAAASSSAFLTFADILLNALRTRKYGDGKGSEVDLTEDKSEYRSDDILVQGSHYSGERSTDDNADCHAHYIALRNKLFKFTNESFQYYYLLNYNHTNRAIVSKKVHLINAFKIQKVDDIYRFYWIDGDIVYIILDGD